MFYVYVYRDPRPTKQRQPVYVGKGHGDRDTAHWTRKSHNKPFQDFLSHLRRRGLEPICERVFETDNEKEAFDEEIRLIALYGRRDTGSGSLFNRTDGGEGVVGRIKTDAEREADRQNTLSNWKNPAYAEKVRARQKAVQGSPEQRAKKSENSKKLWEEKRDKIAAGIKRGRSTSESRAKTSQRSKEMWANPEYAKAQTERNREIASRAEVRAAKSAAAKARWADPEWRAKMLAARAAKKKAAGGCSCYPTVLTYKDGAVSYDVEYVPEDYERAIEMLLHGEDTKSPDLYWAEARRSFPPHAVALLVHLRAQVDANSGV